MYGFAQKLKLPFTPVTDKQPKAAVVVAELNPEYRAIKQRRQRASPYRYGYPGEIREN